MDLVGYAALGGLERVAIVAGAVIIGYWGYRLYVAEKNAGLVFMALAVAVLVGALATGASHFRTVSEGYQLANAKPAEAPVMPAASDVIADARAPATTAEPSPFRAPEPGAAPEAAGAAPDSTTPVTVEVAVEKSPGVPAEPDVAAEPAAAPAAAEPATEADSPPAAGTIAALRIATGQELGGRIVSVKSENVSLEWSTDSE